MSALTAKQLLASIAPAASGGRPEPRFGPELARSLAAIDRDQDQRDRQDRSGARLASEALLRAQLRAGAHVLQLEPARDLAAALGLDPIAGRPGIGDPTAFKLREAR